MVPILSFCFLEHCNLLRRNASLGVGMCSQGRWQKVSKGLWVQSMSPFDHKILDIRTTTSPLEPLEVSIEEGTYFSTMVWWMLVLALLTTLLTCLSTLFYVCRILFVSYCIFYFGHHSDDFGIFSEQVIGILLWQCNGSRHHPCYIDGPFSGNTFLVVPLFNFVYNLEATHVILILRHCWQKFFVQIILYLMFIDGL